LLVSNGARRRHDRRPFKVGDLFDRQIALVEPIRPRNLSVGAVGLGDREVDVIGAHIAQLVEVERRLVTQDTAAVRPNGRLYELVPLAGRDQMHAVDPVPEVVSMAAPGVLVETLRADADLTHICGAHEAVLLAGDVKDVHEDFARHDVQTTAFCRCLYPTRGLPYGHP
jgi:hypothetical protein